MWSGTERHKKVASRRGRLPQLFQSWSFGSASKRELLMNKGCLDKKGISSSKTNQDGLPYLSWVASHHCDDHEDQGQLGEKGVYLTYISW